MTSHTLAETTRLERRSLPVWSTLSLVLPLAAVLGVAAANGGFFPTAFGWTALAFAWVTIIAAVLVVPRWGAFDAAWVLAVGALCVFTFCSAIWAGSAGTAVDQGQRAVVYATAVAGALLLLRRRDLERLAVRPRLRRGGDLLLLTGDTPLRRSLRCVQCRRRLSAVRADRLLERARDLRRPRGVARVRHCRRGEKPDAAGPGGCRPGRAAADAVLHVQPRVVGRAARRPRRPAAVQPLA